MLRIQAEALTYDDVSLVPAHSTVLPKDVSPEELIEGIRIVHRGEATLAPRLLLQLIATFVRPARPRAQAPCPFRADGASRPDRPCRAAP